VQEPRIAVIAVAPCPRKAIRVGTAAPLRHRVAESFSCEGAGQCLKAVHRRPRGAQSIRQHHLSVAGNQRVAVTVDGSDHPALTLYDYSITVVRQLASGAE